MSNSFNDSINRILLESRNVDLSGKYTLFTLYTDNTATLHIFEDAGSYEAMKFKFSSNDNIKRLGATKLPENTTFKKLSESLERKFNVPKDTINIRTHDKAQEQPTEAPVAPKAVKESSKTPKKGSVLESVLRGREKFNAKPRNQQEINSLPTEATEPSINSFRPNSSQKIDMSNFQGLD
jgi:hypothetical protein